MGKKKEKRKFSLYLGKKISYWKRGGGGAKISIIWIIYTPADEKIKNHVYIIFSSSSENELSKLAMTFTTDLPIAELQR